MQAYKLPSRPSRWVAKLLKVEFPSSGAVVKTYRLTNPYEWSLDLVITQVGGRIEGVTVHSAAGSFTFTRENAEVFLRFIDALLLDG